MTGSDLSPSRFKISNLCSRSRRSPRANSLQTIILSGKVIPHKLMCTASIPILENIAICFSIFFWRMQYHSPNTSQLARRFDGFIRIHYSLNKTPVGSSYSDNMTFDPDQSDAFDLWPCPFSMQPLIARRRQTLLQLLTLTNPISCKGTEP
jgi:hypothetical protein